MANEQSGEPQSRPRSPSPQSPPPGEEGSSRASSPASRSEPPGFIADAGPQFDPERAAAEPSPAPPPAAEPAPLIEWQPETIEALLMLKGRGLHAAIGVAEADWHYTELDLAAIAPPLTRICNRYEPIAQLAKYSDPLTLAFALGAYGVRSLEERQAAIRQLEGEADTRPIGPAEEVAVDHDVAAAPSPSTAPRQTQWATSAQGPPPAPAAAAPPPPPRPAEADVDPTQLEWEVGPR